MSVAVGARFAFSGTRLYPYVLQRTAAVNIAVLLEALPGAAALMRPRPLCNGIDVSPFGSENEYHKVADATLEHLHEQLDRLVDRDLEEGDVDYEDGVLTLSLGAKGTYVLNKQAPNQQIWSSSPVSGPARYDWVDQAWRYRRTDTELFSQLSHELCDLCGHAVELQPPDATS